jgi:hypothetical protein
MHNSKYLKRILSWVVIGLLVITLGSAQPSRAGTTSSTQAASSSPSTALSGGQYRLTSHQQSSAQTEMDALHGGSYLLSSPAPLGSESGCCCRRYMTCITK